MQCKKCGDEFQIAPKVRKDTKYCEPCRWIKCSICGERKRLTTQQIEHPCWGKFCSNKCAKANSAFRFLKNGYWCVKAPGHPRVYERDYYYEHIIVAEKKLGRLLDTTKETVHHKDGDKLNNDPDNLEVTTRVAHSKHHWPEVSWAEEVGIDHSGYADVKYRAKYKIEKGYHYVFEPDNPMSTGCGYVAIGRKVLAEKLGRPLWYGETVKYINGNRSDNRPENIELRIWKTRFPQKNRYHRLRNGHSTERGYVVIWNPKHPMARKTGYVLEHRLVMAEHLGRNLEPHEHVHHINGNRMDNRLENLELVHRKDHPSKHFRV
jgi:flagellar basal body rod protein FlgC